MKKFTNRAIISLVLVLSMVLSFCSPLSDVLGFTSQATAAELDFDSMSMNTILNYSDSLTWVVSGDSITHNGGWSQGTNSYGEWIEQYLQSIGRGTDSVVLTGIGGAKLSDFQPTATKAGTGTKQFITKYNPDVVFIKLGMNNRPTGEATFKSDYTNILDAVYADGAENGKIPKVIILTPTPVAGENTYDLDVPGQDSVNRMVDWLSEVRTAYNAENGTHIEFVDLRNAFTNERLVLGDDYYQAFFYGPSDGAIHPNAAGQYLIFKTIAKTLGFFDASKTIFNHDYEDLNEGYMYVDSTYISDYTGDYGAADTDDDQMDSNMPTLDSLKQPKLLASADFTSSNGKFGSDSGEVRYVDLMNDAAMTDKLTADEVKSMGTEYSIVFRAKLEDSGDATVFDFKNHNVTLYMSNNKDAAWGSAGGCLMVGFPGHVNRDLWYGTYGVTNGTTKTSTFSNDGIEAAARDGKWHTYAIVQTATELIMYADGVGYTINSGIYLKQTLGAIFGDAVDNGTFEALFGSYGSGSNADAAYGMDGWVDYMQLYNGALSADEVAYLTENGGASDSDEMNKTMPTLSGVDTMASIEFTSDTGIYAGDNKNLIDLTDASVAADPFTFAEAQSLSKSYSVVLRGKFEQGGNANAGILLLSGNGTADWKNALTVGIPSQGYQTWNRIMQNGTAVASPDGQLKITTGTTPAGDGQWHTLVITVSDTTHSFYLDGVLVSARDMSCSIDLGDLFTDASTFAARFGRYSNNDGGSYTLKGSLDYFQFYGQTLTAAQAAELSEVSDAEQMDAQMPSLPQVDEVPNVLASVDFTSENGEFVYNNSDINASTLDLTVEAEGVDTLTVAEAQTLGKEYTIVFHAKTEPHSSRANHPIIYLAGTSTGGFGAQSDKVLMGMPGTSNIYYQVYKNGNSIATINGATTNFGSLRTEMNDGNWHTIAIVQSTSGLTYYVDGTAYPVTTNGGAAITLSADIGSMFADVTEADFDAVIGRYGITDMNWKTQGDFDYWALYDGALTANQIAYLTENSGVADVSSVNWSDIDTINTLWAVAGGQQMIGYQGSVGNRSLLRLIENTARNGGANWDNRDIRILPFATAGYDPEYLVDNYDAIFGGHDYNVFMLLPEVPDVYAADYVHSDALVAAYKKDIETLMTENADKVKVLWSPLASNDDTINPYITAYAEAVRQIASENDTILFFDANKFMNERMEANAALKRNWFEEGMNISPLCALDVTRAFYAHANVTSLLASGELKDHDLRLGTDKRSLKDTVRDYIVPGVSVSGSSITVDASDILAAYPNLSNLRVAVLGATGVGSNHDENWEEIAYFGSGSTVTFTAPWTNAVVTVIGDLNGYSYRFKDVTTDVVAPTLTVEHYTDDLTALEVVGAPAIGFDPAKTTYDVELYQYQRNVQILAQGGDNLSVTVNGEAVEVGALSRQIAVDSTVTVTVKVTGGAGEKSYTLNLTRPDDADIIITEVMYASSGALYDMVEIYNASGEELNLLDYALGYKKDYTDSVYTTENMGKYPYYFTGDDQAFNSRNGSTQTYTGINAITKNSTFWSGDNVEEEPDYIAFPADSTMILWVKFGGASATYETLIDTLQNSDTTYTLPDGTKVVPGADIVAIAERPSGVSKSGAVSTGYGALPPAETTFHLEDHTTLTANDDNTTRSWMFILKDTAVRDDNASITEAGNDIISASMLVRPTDSFDMSTVLYYDNDRGMALAKNPVSYNATEDGAPYYSYEYSYANYTTFGAVEYWQKPADRGDTTAPVVGNNTPKVVITGSDTAIDLNLTDDEDVRYMELYVKLDGETEYTKVVKDFVLEAGVKNNGVSADQTEIAYTYALEDLDKAVSYYGFVIDGNGNRTAFGSEAEPLTIGLTDAGTVNVQMSIVNAKDEAVTDTSVKADVTIKIEKGEALAEIMDSYNVVDGNGNIVGTIENFTGTVSVANGESVSVEGLPVGAVYVVSAEAPTGYYVNGEATHTGSIYKDTVSEVKLTVKAEKVTADLAVTMDVQKHDGTAEDASVKANVTITVTAGDAADHALSGTYTIEGSQTVLAPDGETGNWVATVALGNGETVTVKGLPTGATYTLRVTAPEGYQDQTDDASLAGSVAASAEAVKLSVKEEAPKLGDLKVTASVTDHEGNGDDATAYVTITVTGGELEGTYTIEGSEATLAEDITTHTWTAAVSLGNGASVTVKDLPAGVSYTVTAAQTEGYTVSAAASGTITADETAETAVSMVKDAPKFGDLKVSASVTDHEGAADTAKAEVTVTVTGENLEGEYTIEGSEVTLKQDGETKNWTATVSLGNGESITIKNLPEDAAYSVAVVTPEGYTDQTVADQLTGSIAEGESAAAVKLQKNAPEAPKTGDLKVTLSVTDHEGNADSGKATVTITLTGGNLSGSYTIVDAGDKVLTTIENVDGKYTGTVELANGSEVYVKGLVVGTEYTVAHTTPDGYQNKTEAALTGTIEESKTAEVALAIRKDAPKYGDLKVDMDLQKHDGTAEDAAVKAAVKITVSAGADADHALSGEYTIEGTDVTLKQDGTTGNWVAVVELANGESVTVKGLPAGASYSVSAELEGYDNKTGNADGTVSESAAASVSVKVQEQAPKTGDLKVSASVTDHTGAADTGKLAVTITVTGEKLEGEYVIDGSDVKLQQNGSVWSAVVTLGNGGSVTVQNLPAGAAYQVSFDLPEGYENKTTASLSGSIADSVTAETAVAVRKLAPKGDLKVELSVTDHEGNADASAEATVKITLTGEDLADTYDVVNASGEKIGTISKSGDSYVGTVNLGNGEAACVKDLTVGTGYTVEITAPAGYTVVSGASSTGTITEGTASVVSPVVKKDAPKYGSVSVEMVVTDHEGNADSGKGKVEITLNGENLADSYDIVNASGEKIGTVTKAGDSYVGTVELGNGETALIENLPVGTKFTVTTTVPEGYELVSGGSASGAVVESATSVAAPVVKKDAPEAPTDPTEPEEEDKPTNGNPPTGEDYHVIVWVLVLLVAAAAFVALLLIKRRGSKK